MRRLARLALVCFPALACSSGGGNEPTGPDERQLNGRIIFAWDSLGPSGDVLAGEVRSVRPDGSERRVIVGRGIVGRASDLRVSRSGDRIHVVGGSRVTTFDGSGALLGTADRPAGTEFSDISPAGDRVLWTFTESEPPDPPAISTAIDGTDPMPLGLPSGIATLFEFRYLAASTPRIVFRGIEDGASTQIYSVAPDGTNLAQLTATTGGKGGIVPSPDGSRIAFRTGGGIWWIDSGGGEPTLLIADTDFPAVGGQTRDFTWSADGSRSLVTYDHSTSARGLWALTGFGGDFRQVTDETTLFEGYSWGPESDHIAVSLGFPYRDIAVFEVGTGMRVVATGDDGTDERFPHWIP